MKIGKLSGLIGVIVSCVVLSLSGCGIDEYVYLYPVTNPHLPSADIANNYFSFKTSDNKNSDSEENISDSTGSDNKLNFNVQIKK